MMNESKIAWAIVGPVVLLLLLYGIVCAWIGHLISRRRIVRDEMHGESVAQPEKEPNLKRLNEAFERGTLLCEYVMGEEDDQGFAELIPLRKAA